MTTPTTSRMPVGVIGAGAIGRMHVERMLHNADVSLAAIADPMPAARAVAEAAGAPYFADYREMLEKVAMKVVIVATPNDTHADVGIACIGHGLPVLMEKPVANSVAEIGGGSVLINLIHDIDLLRFLVGEVQSVQAMTSSAVRGYEVEDTAGVLLRFANGALGTLAVSDAAVTPWNWDLAAGEAAHYAQVDVDTHFISGTEGSITLPRLNACRHPGKRGWHEPLVQERAMLHRADRYVEQLRHIRAVAEGHEQPLCSGVDGLRTLQVALAAGEAAQTQRPVAL